MELPAARLFAFVRAIALPGRRELDGFPAERSLLAQNGSRPERVAALKWQGMIEYMENAHHACSCRLPQRFDVRTVENIAQERVEHEQRPQWRAVIALAGLMM